MIENYLFDVVSDYIDNEIQYIEGEVDWRDYENNKKEYEEDLDYLNGIDNIKKWDIVNQVLNDNELNNALNETIHFYLYH